MPALEDITGQTFGRLTVTSRAANAARGQARWKCVCACGTERVVLNGSLKSGRARSCGCLQRERSSKRGLVVLTGQKFGRLTVVARAEENGTNGQACWKCVCACGNQVCVRGDSLRRLVTQSCGCLGKERALDANLKDITGQTFGRLTVTIQVGTHNGVAYWSCICECGRILSVRGDSLRDGTTKSCGCFQRDRASETRGENHHNWKGGITPESVKIRTSAEYHAWRTLVFQRDSYTCQLCGSVKGGSLRAHHVKSFSQIVDENGIRTLKAARECEELWDISNGLTLCEECHVDIHRKAA